jgi:hypothetical protein
MAIARLRDIVFLFCSEIASLDYFMNRGNARHTVDRASERAGTGA